MATKSCVVTGAVAKRTDLISSSVTGPPDADDAGFEAEDAAAFKDAPDLGPGEGSSLTDGFDSCVKVCSYRFILKYMKVHVIIHAVETSEHMSTNIRFSYKIMTKGHYTTFFADALLVVFASSLPDFFFDFDLEVDGVPRAVPAGVVFDGLLSVGSSFGPSFCFGARTGDIAVSSSICTVQKRIHLEQHNFTDPQVNTIYKITMQLRGFYLL